MQVCVVGRGQQHSVSELALKKGMVRVQGELASMYLAGKPGLAWVDDPAEPKYAVTSLPNGLCSVFAHVGEPKRIRSSMESWLPPNGSGFTYNSESVPSDAGISTTSYTLYRGQNVLERWVISIATSESSHLKAVMSYDAP